ncbi:MAG: hypothetical protein IJC70_00230 [Firmicutes bacterium]|nr:hypothetical protein [Bacillota bacterium]
MLQTIRTFCYLLLTLLLVALGLAPPAEAAEITVELAAAPDGVLQVTEQISLPAHSAAFTRRLPLVTPQGQKVIVSQLAVEGGSCRRERQGDQLLLHISADAPGQQLSLSYRYDAGADADAAGDHLLFPLIDADLPAVQRGEFRLTLPRGFTLARCRIISGDAESRRNRHVEWEMEQELFSGRLKLPLMAGESVWLYVDLPQGYWIGARSNADLSPQVALVALVGLAGYTVVYRKRMNDIGGAAASAAALGRSHAAAPIRAAAPKRGTMAGAGATARFFAAGRWLGRRDRVDPPATLRSAAPITKGGQGEARDPAHRRGERGDAVGRGLAPAAAPGTQISMGAAAPGTQQTSGGAAPPAPPVPPICIHSILTSGHPSAAEFALQPLLWLAQGCIDIREDSCGAIVLQQLQPLPATATAAEKLLWARLFAAKQGDTACLSFAAAELHPLLDRCARRTLAAYTAPPLHRSPRRLSAALPAAALLMAQLLACCRLRLRLITTFALIAAAAALLLLFLLLLTRLLRRGSPAVSDAYLILPPLLLMGLISAAAWYSGASLPHALFTATAALMQTALAARLIMPTSRRREAAKAAIAEQQNILTRYLQEKPPAVAKDISCYLQLLPLAMSIGRAEEWTQLFAAPPGSSISPRILLHRAHCLYQALLPAFSAAASPLPQRRAG